MTPEQIEKLIVNLDSATAERIAHEYITFRYVEHWSSMAMGLVALLAVGWLIKFLIKSLSEG